MNNFMSKKKKYRFQVELKVEELQHVPFLCQELYVKCRLLNGGFTHHSQSLMVENHAVRWNETFKFCSKMTAKASTGELDSCICRVSVRQEMKGGRSFQKLGFADVNLAQFAGSGGTNCYLLEAYDSKHRLHNSTLKVTVDMTLLSGDPCFKAQASSSQPPVIDGPTDSNVKPPDTAGSVGSIQSLGYNSLDKKKKAKEDLEVEETDQAGHSRNSSNTSGSGYVSNASHSDKSGHARLELSEFPYYTLQRIKSMFLSSSRKGVDDDHTILSDSSSSRAIGARYKVSVLEALSRSELLATCCVCNRVSVVRDPPSLKADNGPLILPIGDCKEFDKTYSDLCRNLSRLTALHRLSSNDSTCSRSGSQGSGATGSEGGSLERPVGSRTKSMQHCDSSKDPRLLSTREDPMELVNQIFQDTIGTIKPTDNVGTPPGLQLYIGQDGTASFSGSAIRSKPIIINKR